MDVGIERQLPLILTQLKNILRHHLIGMIVEEDVDRSQLAESLIHDLSAIVSPLQVDRIEVTLLPMLLHLALRLLGILLFCGQVRNKAIRALHSK